MTDDQFEELMGVLKSINSKLDSIYSDIPSLPTTTRDIDDIYKKMDSLIQVVQNLER